MGCGREPDGWSFEGRYWQVHEAMFRPALASAGRRHPHLMLGGSGGPRALRLAAAYADEYDLTSASPEAARDVVERLDKACVAAGRDPATIVCSAMTGMLIGSDEAEVQRRLSAQLEMFGMDRDEGDAWLAARRDRWILGTPEQASAGIAAFEAAGVERLVLQTFVPRDLEMIRLAGQLVADRVAT